MGLPLNEDAMTERDNKLIGSSTAGFLIFVVRAGESRFVDEIPTSEHRV